MKRWSKKVWLSAVALVIAIMSVSAIPASADVSRVIYFSIPINNPCGTTSSTQFYKSEFNFNINNLGNSPANVIVYLYMKDGTPYVLAGTSGTGSSSDFTPGVPVTINANSTIQYLKGFGQSSATDILESCENRPAYGKIEVNSSSGYLLASGVAQSLKYLTTATPVHWEMYNNATINVNGGQPF